VLFFILFPLVALAQEVKNIALDPEADARFENGVILYNNTKYADAYETFSRLLGENRWHQRLTATLLMRAKTSYMLRNYKAAEEDVRELAKSFPDSRYIDHAQILMGLIHFQRRDLFNATRIFLLTTDFAKDEAIREKGAYISNILLKDYLNLQAIERLHEQVTSPNAKTLLIIAEARKDLQQENVEGARTLIDNYLKENPRSRYLADLIVLRKEDTFVKARAPKLGVVLPLSGDLAPEGRAIYRGIRYAELKRKERNASQQRVELVVKDSESRMIKAVTQVQKLTNDPSVLCVIGELDAMITTGLAGIAQAKDVPFIAPTTAENGLTTIGNGVFQITPDYETQARAIVQYAIDSLKFHTFVTIAPQDEYGRQMVDAFSAEVDRLGGIIITQRWYYGVPENLGRHFKMIRELAFRRGLEDTLRPQIPNFAQIDKDSLWRAFNMRMMIKNNLNKPITDLPGFFPVRNIDAVFLPIYNEDIKFIARQLSYYNIRARILGGDEWYHDTLIKDRDLQRYINGAIFSSSYFIDTGSPDYKNFRDQFRLAMGVTPQKWQMLGFDTANLLFRAIDKGATTRRSLRNILYGLTNFRGVGGEMRFSAENRVNENVYLLQIRNGGIYRVK
jgi:branched-chain amino acid transport system substrate-binding protein